MEIIKKKKKFGQHFLDNDIIALDIINSLKFKKNVLEIGPGNGVLTRFLLKKKY